MAESKPSFRECLNNALAVCELPEISVESHRWELSRSNPGIALLNLNQKVYRLVDRNTLELGFSEWLLGAHYHQDVLGDEKSLPGIDSSTREKIAKRATDGRFYVVLYEDLKDPEGEHLPLFTVFKDADGHAYILELNSHNVGKNRLFSLLLAYSVAISNYPYSLSEYDTFGDYLRLGAPSVVQRHSTEMVKKHLAKKVVLNRDLCTQCFRCVPSCSELKATPTPEGMRLLGPAEDHCTNCGLCQKRCPYLTPHLKDELPATFYPDVPLYQGGECLVLEGKAGEELSRWLEEETGKIKDFPFNVNRVYCGESIAQKNGEPVCRVEQYELFPIYGDHGARRPLLVSRTVFSDDGSPDRVIIRQEANVVVLLHTKEGHIEMDMASRVQLAGTRLMGVIDQHKRSSIVGTNVAVRRLAKLGLLEEGENLDHMVSGGKVDIVLSPYLKAVSRDVQTTFLELTGGVSRVMAPNVIQAFTFTNDPLINEIRDILVDIFPRYPELMLAESEMARSFLSDIATNSSHIHARYRTMAVASGHSACPTCAEAQVLAIPIYMAILMSFARGEVPEITFTCETGCMSETLNKTCEVAQKVKGGRTVFGGGFAFAEAIAMSEELAIRYGFLKKGRRYVVSQGGDGGSVIGLPAWLNALRQRAYVIRKRMPSVLNFIVITDTQVYSNTGGECSASSLLGMGTLTTPIGKYILGNQKVQWNLINLAAEFPNILVGLGHSGNRVAMQEFWYLADRLGFSAIRWDVTPCPETGKFFGEDPDNLAYAMAHAGMLPEVVFVGRLRKRVAPVNPADIGKPWREWGREFKPITYWLAQDPRYRAMLRKNPQSGEWEPINTAARFVIKQLERYRDQLNWQIDLENMIVREAEEIVEDFFDGLQKQWEHYKYNLQQFRYAFLFNDEGEMKPEFRDSLKWEMLQLTIGMDALTRYRLKQQSMMAENEQLLNAFFAGVEELEKVAGTLAEKLDEKKASSGVRKIVDELEHLSSMLKEKELSDRKELESILLGDDVAGSSDQASPKGVGYSNIRQAREARLYEILDRLIEDRAVAKQTEISQYVLAKKLRSDFINQGGVFREPPAAELTEEREQLRKFVKDIGYFAIGVASLAGERGIAINRIFSNFFTQKGLWAGMAWQFGSSKRGTPVLSATFIAPEPIERKDAMLSFPYYVMTVTNYGDLKTKPDVFFDNLHPTGYLIINTRISPEEVREELIEAYDEQIRSLVRELREISKGWDATRMMEWVSQKMFDLNLRSLNVDQKRLVQKVAALASCTIVTLDMDGIMEEVTGSDKIVSNLVAVAPLFKALQMLGFPFDFEKDQNILLSGFPGAVLKNKELLNYYLEAIKVAFERAKGWPAEVQKKEPARVEDAGVTLDPGNFYTEMGGTVAGLVLSQIAFDKHPICYVGFPITPAGNPFYAMAQVYANGHPYVYVDEINPSEKVAAEKLIGIARAGGMLPVTFTASQGWRLFTEIIPQFVGARLEGLFLIARRALAAPNLNIEESHTDFMSFRDDGGIMLTPKSVQEYISALYLARLLTHFAKLPVIVSIGGITDTHKIGLFSIPPDNRVRAWLKKTLKDFDFLEHKLINRQGEIIVHGPSGTSEVYQETQSEIEKAHQMVRHVFPYAVRAVEELTGYRFEEVEVEYAGVENECRTMLILQGSLYPNAVAALRELSGRGWRGMGCMSIRMFNPFPESRVAEVLNDVDNIVVLDRSNSFGSVPPLASRIFTTVSRYLDSSSRTLRTMVGGLGGREILVDEMKEIFLFSHLLLQPGARPMDEKLAKDVKEDHVVEAMTEELAALELRNFRRHTRVPRHLCSAGDEVKLKQHVKDQLLGYLVNGNYLEFLQNYNQIEFIGAKELLRETELRRQLVVRVEILRARNAIKEERAGAREVLTLLQYSLDRNDWREAGKYVASLFERGEIPRKLLLDYQGRLEEAEVELVVKDDFETLTRSTSSQEQKPVSHSGDTPGDFIPARPSFAWDEEEAELIREKISRLVHLNGKEEMYYNPEDFERAVLDRLEKNKNSQLCRALEENPDVERSDIRAAYEECYREDINRAITREILVEDFAPELREIFEGEGLEELKLIVLASISFRKSRGEEISEKKIREIQQEVVNYLAQEILPALPKSPGFYLDYYYNMVEPDLKKYIQHNI